MNPPPTWWPEVGERSWAILQKCAQDGAQFRQNDHPRNARKDDEDDEEGRQYQYHWFDGRLRLRGD